MSGGELKAWNIGISLGTSSIRIAVFRNGAAEIIPDEQGNPEMPAWLSFLKDKPLIGATAKDNIAMNPRYTFHSINRFIGQSLRDSRPKCQIQHVGFKLSRSSASESSDIALATPKGYGVASMTVGEMLALLLLRAKMNAEAYLGGQVAGAVIGIPVRFTQYQRSVVRNAAEAAGLTVLGLLDTPASILLGHNLENDKVLNSVAIDMGAGFCNIGVATIDGRTVEMRSVRGNTYGGDDVDATLLRYLFRNPARRQNCHIVWDAAVIPRLRQICEGVKIGLSTATQYSLGPEVLSRHRAIKRDVVTRKEFEKACLKGWMSTSVLEGALKDAKMKKSEIHQIILAGSMSRIPALQTLLEEFFKRKLRFPAANDREEVEVRGLAFHAFQLASTAGPHQPHVRQSPWIKQVLTMSLGFETAEGKLLPIMPRNHPFPGRASDDIEISQTGLVIGRWLGSKSSSSSSTPTEGTVRSSAGFINVYESVSSDIKNCRLISRIDITTFLPVPYLRVIFDKDQDQLVTITIKHPYKALTVRAFLDERLIPLDSESELIRGQLIDSERASQMEIARAAEAQKFKNRLETLRSHGLQWRPFSSRDTEKKILTFIREADLWMEKNPDAPVGAYWGYNTALDNLRAQEDLGSDLSTFIPDRSSPKFSASVASDARADVADSAYIKNDWIDINHEILHSDSKHEHNENERQQAEPEINMGAAQSPSSGIRDHARFREPDSKTKVKRELEEAEDRDSSRHLGLQATTSILWTPDDDLGNLFSVGDREVKEYTDKDFERVSNYLESRRHTSWVAVPRIYTVLRLIDQLDNVEAFVQQGLTDMWFPFSVNTLPKSLPPSAQTRFLEIQSVVFAKSKSFQLETSERKHAHFSANEPLPLQSIAKLGFGAHGSVDKVISTLTHKVYARKLFRKAKGLRREDVQTFRTELDILKRISHKHCVALVATYSDPKFFGLLMDPVGDYNLETFYDLASRAKNGDKLTLLRSFFGCLAEAVAYLHAQQIRHRDIKPQNIIVRGDEVFVADFGIAFSWEHLTRATTTADSGKTLIYAAPEVIRVEPRNEAADVWSLGCVFFEMATVLHGQTVKDLRDYFMDQSDSRSFHANLNTLESWAASLISSTVTQAHLTTLASTSNITFHWALKLLRPDPTQRLTAAALAEEIIKESASRGIHFCGDCCQTAIAASSTDDDDADDDDDVWGDED
ncbi:Hsp70 protein-domain-containing protein [Cladorrhinum sp. PSN332]|nr:Hsp70 protein-domain-containing protein [Cladorrhinum sp. PSN332]